MNTQKNMEPVYTESAYLSKEKNQAQVYIQNILTKEREAQERVDRLTILMYQRFIMETENWDDFK
jgi:hypothetical protein